MDVFSEWIFSSYHVDKDHVCLRTRPFDFSLAKKWGKRMRNILLDLRTSPILKIFQIGVADEDGKFSSIDVFYQGLKNWVFLCSFDEEYFKERFNLDFTKHYSSQELLTEITAKIHLTLRALGDEQRKLEQEAAKRKERFQDLDRFLICVLGREKVQ